MNKKIHKYWMLVASKNHVTRGVEEGIAQACHGKAHPLKRMNVGDGIIYYSPKLEFEKNISCQEFTAIGLVSGEEVYPYDMGNGFIPYRRNIKYANAHPVQIKPLIGKLQFITNKKQWGYKFRFGAFEISEIDFQLIAKEMRAIL
jgi:EVE domain-containing protein